MRKYGLKTLFAVGLLFILGTAFIATPANSQGPLDGPAEQARVIQYGAIQAVSRAVNRVEGNGPSYSPAVSADGHYVVFQSSASNLVSNDTNNQEDVFLFNGWLHQILRISEYIDGGQIAGASYSADISADGQIVVFITTVTNPGGGNYATLFIVDGSEGLFDGSAGNARPVVLAVSKGSAYGPAISADGKYVAFGSFDDSLVSGDTNGLGDVFVLEMPAGSISRVSLPADPTEGNRHPLALDISGNGRFVAFGSEASTLVSGDTNGMPDIFVYDRNTGTTSRVSVASDGTQANGWSFGPSLSADGRYVTFGSYADNLVQGDTNLYEDVFVHDRTTGLTTRVSVAADGAQANKYSAPRSLSADGRYVAFESAASNLVSGDTNGVTDVFVHDRTTGAVVRVSVALDGSEGNGHSQSGILSADGRYVVFGSEASNLIVDDTNQQSDVFIAPAGGPAFFFGDTVGVFRPSTTTFYLRNSNTTGPADIAVLFGGATDLPVAGDWDGDGVDTVGVFRNGVFFLKDSNSTGAPLAYRFTLGNPGDLPMAGDWNAGGKDSVGVFRPTNGRLYLRNALSTGFASSAMVFGINGDRPVAGDWNGDGYDTPGIYRPSNATFYLTNMGSGIANAHYQLMLGTAGDIGFAGDWDGNGVSSVGVFRPTNSRIYLRNVLTTGNADIVFTYGLAGDRPVAGNWVAANAPQQAPPFEPGR